MWHINLESWIHYSYLAIKFCHLKFAWLIALASTRTHQPSCSFEALSVLLQLTFSSSQLMKSQCISTIVSLLSTWIVFDLTCLTCHVKIIWKWTHVKWKCSFHVLDYCALAFKGYLDKTLQTLSLSITLKL